MTRLGWIRFGIVGGAIVLLELMCRFGVIGRRVLIPPSDMAVQLWNLLRSGRINNDLSETLLNVAASIALAVAVGFAVGSVIHALPRVRRAIEPFLASYYALPFFAFYPVFIVLFGIGRMPIIVIGFLFGVVAMVIATFNGFDRIPRALVRTARAYRMGPVETALKIKLPYAAPFLFTGVKLAVAYSFIGVIAAEFILASSGLGYSIAYAFNNFDNRTMYALMLLVIVLVTVVNALLHVGEARLMRRRGL